MARVALVTGGTRGIGAAISTALQAAGYKVAASYAGNEVAAAKFTAATGVPAYKWDVSNYAACAAGIAKVEADLGPVEILVNNAGITSDAMFHRMTPEQWLAVVNTNLNSLFNMCRPIIGGMRERNFGRIINISSINGQKGQAGQVNYSATKAGEIGFTKALAQENAQKGITVNAICPGYVATEMVLAVPKEILAKNILPLIPVGRLGQPEEVARCVLFLASDDAGFITGSTLTANGGQYFVLTGGATSIGFIAVVLWSSLAALTSTSGSVPPFELAAMTFTLSGVVGLAITTGRRRLAALRLPWQVCCLGVGGIFGYHALYFSALRLTPPAQASLINYLWPLLIVVFSTFLPGERLAGRHVAGALAGLAGVSVLIAGPALAGGGATFDRGHIEGYALALGAAVTWSSYSVLSRRFKQVPSDSVAFFCAATAVLAALCHVLFEPTVWPQRASEWVAIVALGLGPLGLAFYVWDFGVKHGDIRLLGVASYAAPVLSTLLLVATGYAAPTWELALACALITGGAVLASLHRESETLPMQQP